MTFFLSAQSSPPTLGNFSSPAPTCIPIQCPPLFLEDPHLSLIELNTSAWGRAVFSCSWGYRLSGPSNLECLASGHWSGWVGSVLCLLGQFGWFDSFSSLIFNPFFLSLSLSCVVSDQFRGVEVSAELAAEFPISSSQKCPRMRWKIQCVAKLMKLMNEQTRENEDEEKCSIFNRSQLDVNISMIAKSYRMRSISPSLSLHTFHSELNSSSQSILLRRPTHPNSSLTIFPNFILFLLFGCVMLREEMKHFDTH